MLGPQKAWAASRICSSPLRPIISRFRWTEEKLGSIPKHYIECTLDRAVTPSGQQRALQTNMRFTTIQRLESTIPPSYRCRRDCGPHRRAVSGRPVELKATPGPRPSSLGRPGVVRLQVVLPPNTPSSSPWSVRRPATWVGREAPAGVARHNAIRSRPPRAEAGLLERLAD